MQDQSTLMSSKCDTLCAAFGIESSETSTHLKPAGAEPGAMPPAVDGGAITRTLVSDSAAETPFLIAETSTQYVSASPIARPISGSSKPSPTSAPIAESPCVSEASILAQAVRTPPATKGAARAVAAPAAPALGVCTLPEQVPPSDILWRLLTGGYDFGYIRSLDDGNPDKQFLVARANQVWALIRAELGQCA